MDTNVKTLEFNGGVWMQQGVAGRFGMFEDQYIEIRDKEQRIFSIEEIRKLPLVPESHVHTTEWKMRTGSIERFTKYLRKKGTDKALDIGCGNGFFTNIISRYCNEVYGLDVNLTELKQATKAFADNTKLQWYYADILAPGLFEPETFDLITFCCSFQYFFNVKQILDACLHYLKPGGAVHIIDTPFYTDAALEKARDGSVEYYHNMGHSDLAQHYFHHTWEDIKPYEPIVRYKKSDSRIASLFTANPSPFPWIEIRKP